MINVSLVTEPIFYIKSFPITNSELSAFLITVFILIFCLIARRSMAIIPSRLQAFLEIIVGFVMDQLKVAFGSEKRAKKFFPLIMSILIFITIANQLSLVPLIYQITYEGKTALRTATSDLNLTLGLALLVIVLAQILSFIASPLGHIGKYIKLKQFLKVRSFGDFGNAFLEFFLGLLDIIGELSKILSMSFRLFGNIFAGEVLVAVIAGLSVYTSFILPIPFILISIFSGFVQAFVFMLLSIQFISGTIGSEKEKDTPDKEKTHTNSGLPLTSKPGQAPA